MMDKKTFVKIINRLKNVETYHNDLNDFFQSHSVGGFLYQPDCSTDVIELLHIIFSEQDEDNIIAAYCIESNYGLQWNRVKNNRHLDIDIATPEDLYDYLVGTVV